MPVSHEEYADLYFVYGFCNDDDTDALEEYRQRHPRRRIHDRRGFTRVHQYLGGKGSFSSVNRRAKPQVQRSVEEKQNVIDMLQRSPRSSTRISARLILLISVENAMYGEWLHRNHIQSIQHLGRAVMGKQPQFCGWINANSHTIHNLLLTDEALFTPYGVSNTKFPRKFPKRTHRLTFS